MKVNFKHLGILLLVAVLVISMLEVCSWYHSARKSEIPSKNAKLVLTTGYCNCGKCCGWKRSWFGFGSPVYSYGRLKGRPKKVGITASGTKAHHGTIAADLKLYPMGTHLNVPGYGKGVVEDIGGAIKGQHIDLWFPTHEEAKRWGKRWLKIDVLR